jgi:hypothetical protein
VFFENTPAGSMRLDPFFE